MGLHLINLKKKKNSNSCFYNFEVTSNLMLWFSQLNQWRPMQKLGFTMLSQGPETKRLSLFFLALTMTFREITATKETLDHVCDRS